MPSKSSASRVALRRSPLVVTIDGPAGVGKSTAARLLARRLGLTYLDTGATYRALAYAARQAGLHPMNDIARIAALGRRLPMQLRQGHDGILRVLVEGHDITRHIRTEEVTEFTALISQHPLVRAAMVRLQRRLADTCGIVVEGRDTGSIVFPRATHKFFLDAAPAVRARRRQQELAQLHGYRLPLKEVQAQLHFRDDMDLRRRVGPLVKPRGAIAINTSRRSAAQVVAAMLRRIRPRLRA